MATAKKVKKLSSTVVNKDQKVLDEQLLVTIFSQVNKEEYELKIDKVFRKSKAMQLALELVNAAQYAQANNVEFELIFAQYCLLLIIKHFTTFGDGMTDNIMEQIALLGKLDDLGLLEPVIDAMPEDQVEFVFGLVEKTMEAMSENVELTLEELTKLVDDYELEK